MPRLAGSYDLTDDGRLDMQIASGIGQGIGRFIERRREAKEADRLRAEEEKRQETDALIVRILHQSQLNDWDGKHTLQALMQIPGYINSTFAKQQALRDMQPKGLPFGVSPEQYAAANRAEIERKIKGSSGGRRVIEFWDKDGNKHKKLVADDNFNDVIQSIIESGGRLEEDSLTKELSYWQTSLQKTLDPLGDVLPGQEETAALANERISILRNMIRGKSLPAEQPQLQGDMTEQQADTALKEIMSPEAYQQAKATGIPATELLQSVNAYLQQNKTVNNNPAQQSEKTEVNNQDENLSKEFNSMLEGGSFAEYRKRFAAGIPQKQIEEAYKNDPFVPANNSKLAEPGYKPKTKLRTWEELTDYQRERAYELYLDQNKQPLGDRFGMAVARVISKADYENYKRKKKEHESKLLTKEQFAKKAQNDNQFLWKFVKISNQKGPVEINRADVDVHRALDSQRLPVFRGL